MVRGSPNPKHFGLIKRLRQARKAANVPPTSLARVAGVSPETVARIEGGVMPGVDVVERIARALQIPAASLAFGLEVKVIPDEGGVFIADSPLRCSGMGERLRLARVGGDVSMRALARAASVSGNLISLIEMGRVLPRLDVAERICQAVDRSPAALIYLEGPPDAPWPRITRPGAGPRRKTTAPRVARRKG